MANGNRNKVLIATNARIIIRVFVAILKAIDDGMVNTGYLHLLQIIPYHF